VKDLPEPLALENHASHYMAQKDCEEAECLKE